MIRNPPEQDIEIVLITTLLLWSLSLQQIMFAIKNSRQKESLMVQTSQLHDIYIEVTETSFIIRYAKNNSMAYGTRVHSGSILILPVSMHPIPHTDTF